MIYSSIYSKVVGSKYIYKNNNNIVIIEYIYKEKKMRKLLTTLLPYRNSLKHSDLSKNNLLPYLLPLTTSYYLCEHKSFLYIMFMQIVVFMYKFLSNVSILLQLNKKI